MHHDFQAPKCFISYAESHTDTRMLWESHCHAQYEMIAVLEGDVNITLDGRLCRLREHQVIIIPPLIYHTVSANTAGAYKRITALFDLCSVPQVLHQDFLSLDAQMPSFTATATQLESLRECCEASDVSYYEPLIDSLMVSLMYGRCKTPLRGLEPMQANEVVLKLIDYIDEHLCEKILLEDLARYVSLSKFFLCHLFEAEMGIPPKQYILQKRMAYAEMMLSQGKSATAVAVELGYKSYTSFWRMYQKYCGVNPMKSKPAKK